MILLSFFTMILSLNLYCHSSAKKATIPTAAILLPINCVQLLYIRDRIGACPPPPPARLDLLAPCEQAGTRLVSTQQSALFFQAHWF